MDASLARLIGPALLAVADGLDEAAAKRVRSSTDAVDQIQGIANAIYVMAQVGEVHRASFAPLRPFLSNKYFVVSPLLLGRIRDGLRRLSSVITPYWVRVIDGEIVDQLSTGGWVSNDVVRMILALCDHAQARYTFDLGTADEFRGSIAHLIPLAAWGRDGVSDA